MALVTLQINLAPSDYAFARHLLPHQVRVWGGQVSEILLVIDLHRSRGRFADGWEEGRDAILALANSIAGARVVTVDYSAKARHAVATEFFGGRPVPTKDFRGGPYYSYFFGLYAAFHPFVLHTDADLFFGGGSQTWLTEATSAMAATPDILLTAPLPGPPAPDEKLRHLSGEREAGANFSFRFTEMSTRLFLLDRQRFRERIGALHPRRPSFKNCLLALLDGNPPRDLPENLLTHEMQKHGLHRRDFLGSAPGMWSLHPPYRCADFYEKLPQLISRIETGDLPAAQLGDHDINASLVDWSEAIARMKTRRWWHRLRQRLLPRP